MLPVIRAAGRRQRPGQGGRGWADLHSVTLGAGGKGWAVMAQGPHRGAAPVSGPGHGMIGQPMPPASALPWCSPSTALPTCVHLKANALEGHPKAPAGPHLSCWDQLAVSWWGQERGKEGGHQRDFSHLAPPTLISQRSELGPCPRDGAGMAKTTTWLCDQRLCEGQDRAPGQPLSLRLA